MTTSNMIGSFVVDDFVDVPSTDLVPIGLEVEISVPRAEPIVGGRAYSLGFGSHEGVHHVVFVTLRSPEGETLPVGTSTVQMTCDFPRRGLHKLVPGLRAAIMEGARPFAPCVIVDVHPRHG